MKPTTLLILVAMLFSGCSENTERTSGDFASAQQLTPELLAKGIGLHWWTVEAPSDISSTDYAGLGYRSTDGTETFFGASDGWKPNEKAYIFLIKDGDETPSIRIVRDSGSSPTKLKGSIFEKLNRSFFLSNNHPYKFGELFAKMGADSNNEGFSTGDMLYDGQIGFYVDIMNSK